MRIELTNQSFLIPAGQAVSGIAECAQTLQIAAGDVWITVAGSSQDYWLSAGDQLALAPGRLIVMEANKSDSKIALQPITGDCNPWTIGRQLGERLAALAQRLHLTAPAPLNKTCNCS
jgi:hypothetical protein